MPLIDLKTKFTSLKYSSDRRNNGYSGQPYIQFPIEQAGIGQTFSNYYTNNRNSLDYPIRGGSLDFNIGTQTLTISSAIDRERIKKFLSDSPRGTAFIQKQIGLQLSNPKTETGNSLVAFGSFSALPGVLENTRLYNGGRNTLAQVGAAGTGVHFNRHGLFPLDLSSKYYRDIVGAQLNMSSEEAQSQNRLLILQQLKLRSQTPISSTVNLGESLGKINQLGISLNRNIIQNYLGGPGSTYGLGNTVIRRYEDTSQAVRRVRSGAALSYDQIMDMPVRGARSRMERVTNTNLYVADQETVDYKFYNFNGPSGSITDKINVALLNEFSSDPWPNAENDLIKFGFECINNDNPDSALFIQFRALLTAGLTDSHQASYNTFKYIGRAEDFLVYQGFSRTIGFSFNVAAFSKAELVNIYDKLNALVSQIYPDYSSMGVMRSSLIRLTVGDYLYRVPGFLDSVDFTIDQETSWEISDGEQLPHFVNVQVSFRPIHDVLPKRSSLDSKTQLIVNNPKTQKLRDARDSQRATNSIPNDLTTNTDLTDTERNSLNRLITR